MIDAPWHVRRHERAKAARDTLAWIWRDSYQYTYPCRGTRWWTGGVGVSNAGQSEAAQGASGQAQLLDETGTDAVRILASALKDGGTPATSRWFGLEVDDADDAGEVFLDRASERTWKFIHASGYDSVGYECLVDLVCAGQFVMFVEEDEDPAGHPYRFTQWEFADCTFSASKSAGRVDTISRDFQMTAEQAVNTYGDGGRLGENITGMATTEPDKLFQFLWCIYPREGPHGPFALNMPFASCIIDKQTKAVIHESGFNEFPCVVPRWMLIPGSQYAVGPAYEALPAMRQLNKTIELQILGLELHAGAGTYKGYDDGVFNPRTVKLGSRRVVVVGEIDNLVPLAQAGDMKATLIDIERLQKNIRKVLLADALEPQDTGTKTATEVQIRLDLIRQQLGPLYGRMEAEYHTALVERCFAIALRRGAFGPVPRSIANKQYKVRYQSPLARAQRMVDVNAIDRYVQSTMVDAQIDPTVTDNIDIKAANKMRAERLGVPRELLREQAAVDKLVKERAVRQSAAEAEHMMAAGAQAADNQQLSTAATAGAGVADRMQAMRTAAA